MTPPSPSGTPSSGAKKDITRLCNIVTRGWNTAIKICNNITRSWTTTTRVWVSLDNGWDGITRDRTVITRSRNAPSPSKAGPSWLGGTPAFFTGVAPDRSPRVAPFAVAQVAPNAPYDVAVSTRPNPTIKVTFDNGSTEETSASGITGASASGMIGTSSLGIGWSSSLGIVREFMLLLIVIAGASSPGIARTSSSRIAGEF